MGESDFAITLPLFALKRGKQYVTFNLHRATPEPGGVAFPIFTSEEKAVAFAGSFPERTEVKRLDRMTGLRVLLEKFTPDDIRGSVVWFDPISVSEDRVKPSRSFSVDAVLERFVPQPIYSWVYPLYILQLNPGGAACVRGCHKGKPVGMLAVFSDSDLADRALAKTPANSVVATIANQNEFVAILRRLPPAVAAVVFDPPADRSKGGPARTAIPREELLADFQIRL